MAMVKAGTSKMPIPDKIQFARQIVSQMTGNANFASPSPTLASVTAMADSLENAYNAAQTALAQARALISARDEISAAFDLLITQEGNYVENESNGDEAKIESSGFPVRRIPAGPIGELPAPSDVEVTPNENEGTMNVRWRKVRGASSYVVQKAADAPELNWMQPLSSTRTKTAVNTMVSGGKYWFRVAAIGTAGQGPWSNAIAKYAP